MTKEQTSSSADAELLKLQKRFAMRLAAALDAIGYPAQRVERTRQLASALSVDLATVTPVLSGYAIPEYSQLLELCSLCNRSPGYFLDERRNEDFPPQTVVVRPLGPGENLAIKLPSDAGLPESLQTGLAYYLAKVPMGFGISAGDYLIVSAAIESAAAEVDKLYLFEGDEGLDVLRCAERTDRHAVFHTDEDRDVPLIVVHGHQKNRTFRLLVANLRCGEALHRPD